MQLRTILCFITMFSPAVTVRADPPTLCKGGEVVYFSCLTKKAKAISLCASANVKAAEGYLIYRYGKAGSAPELEYPAQGALSPSKAFAFSAANGAKGGSEQLSFSIGEYRYTLYSDHWAGADPAEGAGVLIEKAGNRVANIRCTAPLAPQDMDFLGDNTFGFKNDTKPHFVGLPVGNLRCGDPFWACP